MSQITKQSKTVILKTMLTYDSSFINRKYSQNKLYTNVVKLKAKYPLSTFSKVQANTQDAFGSTRKTIHYTIPQGKMPDLEVYSRSFVKALNSDLPDYEAIVLTKKVEYWSKYSYCNAVKFTATVNHVTQKIWITVILTAAFELGEEDEDSGLEEEIQLRVTEPILIPQPLEDSTSNRITRRVKPAPTPSTEIDLLDLDDDSV